MNGIINYIKDSVEEMKHKVSWPKYNELQSSSILVIVGAIVFALLIGAMDFVFKNSMEVVYQSISN